MSKKLVFPFQIESMILKSKKKTSKKDWNWIQDINQNFICPKCKYPKNYGHSDNCKVNEIRSSL